MNPLLRKTVLTLALTFSSALSLAGGERQKQPVNTDPDSTDPQEIDQTSPLLSGEYQSVLGPSATPAIVCPENANAAGMQEKIPQLNHDFNLMAQLPLTGKPVYDVMVDSKNSMTSCVVKTLDGNAVGIYSEKHIKILNVSGTSVTFHEAFHAIQDTEHGWDHISALTAADAAAANLLKEASAVAYEIAAREEASKSHHQFKNNTALTAADDMNNRATFISAYAQFKLKNKSMDTTTQEAKALEAGGKAVVRRLLTGQDTSWRQSYSQNTLANMNSLSGCFCDDGREKNADYNEKRNAVYAQQGRVSPNINFIPDEFLSPEADRHIGQSLQNIGIEKSRLPSPFLSCYLFVIGPTLALALLLTGAGIDHRINKIRQHKLKNLMPA